jgi:DNA-binding NarL/FixJ family response regulator
MMSAADAESFLGEFTLDEQQTYVMPPAIRALGASSFYGNVEFRPTIFARHGNGEANSRWSKFAALKRWPDDSPNPLDEVHEREKDILGLAALGWENGEIGAKLFIAEQTVKFHLDNLYRRFGVDNRTHLGGYMRKAGLFSRVYEDLSGGVWERKGYSATREALDGIIFAEDQIAVPTDDLTTREKEVLGPIIATGANNSEIAGQLGVTEQTVKFHVSNLIRKLNARNRTEAVVVADFASVGVAVRALSGGSNREETVPPVGAERTNEDDLTAYVRGVLGKKAARALVILDAKYGLGMLGDRPIKAGHMMKDAHLAYLEKVGAISATMATRRLVDLPAAILEEQLNDPHASQLVANQNYIQLAIEIANKTAKDFLAIGPQEVTE